MTEGMDWSVWRWLLEKNRVREIADRATAALERANKKVKATWSNELKTAYDELVSQDLTHRREKSLAKEGPTIAPEIKLWAKQVKKADDEAERARLEAEATFDEAERRMSASMAREGARQALKSYDLRESAIRKAQAAALSFPDKSGRRAGVRGPEPIHIASEETSLS